MHVELRQLLPLPLRRLYWLASDSDYRRRYLQQRRIVRTRQQLQLEAWPQLYAQTGGSVVQGPFKGLRYPKDGCWTQKILGTYERELWPCLEALTAGSYDAAIDIGASEGYYAVGLARLLGVPVIAFEAQPGLHATLSQIAAMNQLADRISIHGLCSPVGLRGALTGRARPMILCDAEGAEDDLLDPVLVPELVTADLLVEIHEHLRPGVTERLAHRFRATHLCRHVGATARQRGDFPDTVSLAEHLIAASMDEARDVATSWLWLERRR